MRKLLLRSAFALALAALLAACTQKNTADDQAQSSSAGAAIGIDRFLLFPNPIGTDPFAQDGGSFETNTTEYAAAYYRAIDAGNAKDTIDKWKTANGFGSGTGTEHLAVFRDVKDLGYGRRMTGRMNTDGSVAFYVENYNVAPGGSADYSSDLNVDAAIRRDTQWHVGTNAIEWSTTPCVAGFDPADCNGTVKFAKYYNFSSADGTRQLAVDLDGRGKKVMPGPCITCHGGRGDPLTPPDASGKPRYPLVENLSSRKRGDVGAHLHGQNVDSFSFSITQTGFAKSDLQPFLKDFNQWILCTYPSPTLTPGLTVTGAWGTCTRPTAGANEWQGTAGPMIEAWYGGPGMPAAAFSDTYVPAGWNTNTAIPGTAFTETTLYTNVVAPYCRTCHILRGTKNQDDINFMTLVTPAVGLTPAGGFQTYADRIKVHVFDRGNMPLSLIPHRDFWNSAAPSMLASFIDSQLGVGTATAGGVPLVPGRPIPDPGPDRMVRTGSNAVLTAENSLFANTFSWTVVSGSATITNPSGMVAIFNASVAGPYVVRLTVNGGAFKDVNITVDDNFPDPLNIKFAQVKNVLQNVQHTTVQASNKCIDCHVSPAVSPPTPPVFYNAFDRDLSGGAADATDEAWFLKALQGRVNLTEIKASPLLRKPTGNHHKGLMLLDVTTTSGLRDYSILYNWILAGMQPGGVAASAIVNGGNLGSPTPVALTFSGAPPYATGITLDGSASVGATSFLWTVSGPNGLTGAVPFVLNSTSASAALSPLAPPTLNLPYVGSYVVQLQVSDGVSSDTLQQTITVSEVPVVADFVPATGTATVSFSNTPLKGNITLTSTSTGSPATCRWQASGPAGATLDGFAVLDVTKSCGVPAVLNVPSTSIGGIYVVTLTAISGVGTSASAVTHNLTVASAGSGVVANAGANSNNTLTFVNPNTAIVPVQPGSGPSVAPDPNGIPEATVGLNGSASTGPGTLSYTWSVISQPGTATGPYVASITSPNSVAATLNVHRAGSYTVQLFVSNGLPPGPSNTSTRIINVSANALAFSTLKTRFVSLFCTTCHVTGSISPPSWVDEPTTLDLYNRVFARVNTTDPSQSLIVRCPAEGWCGMGQQNTFFGNANPTNYSEFLNWIVGGAPNN